MSGWPGGIFHARSQVCGNCRVDLQKETPNPMRPWSKDASLLSQPGRQPVLTSISICRLEAESLMPAKQPPKRKCLQRTKHSQASPSFHFYMLNGSKLIIKSIFSVKEQCIPMCFSKGRWHFYFACWQIHHASSQPTSHNLKNRGCI